ncbi:MAG: hypothetical protein PHS15_06490 [Clostridiaceae bacterium]|nr:hypothetical protein [Clostridiaceae bacterium]
MDKKFICPMMCGMQMKYQPEHMYMEPEMPMVEEMEMDNYYEDEEDDRQFMKMYPESCKKMMIYVKVEIDRVEEKDEEMHDYRPDREMINLMADNAYNKMVKEMPEMAEEEVRQYPVRRFSRDLLRLLLLNELFRRRRRRRRRNYYGYPSDGYDFDYDYNNYD